MAKYQTNPKNSQNELPNINLELNQDIFSSIAKDTAYSFDMNKTTSTQMRIFYDYLLKQYENSKNKSFNEILPFVKMLNSKVAYAFGRDKIDRNFKIMIEKCVEQINEKDSEKIEIFKLFFEAVLGFAKGREIEFRRKK